MPETWLNELQDPVARQVVIDAVRALFKRWQLHPVNQAELLGLVDMSDLDLARLPTDESLAFVRIGHLLAIDRALFKRFPYQATTRDRWVWQAQQQLHGQTPMAYMLQEGIEGIKRVRHFLEL